MSELSDLRSKVEREKGAREAFALQLKTYQEARARIVGELLVLEQAQVILQLTAKQTQEQLQLHLQDLVQGAIDAVFPNQYVFRVDFVPKAGNIEADLYLLRDGSRIDPMDSSGGGVVDVVAFALRIVSWSIGATDNCIVLDEPFKFLSVGLRPLAAELLRALSKQLGLQLIYVTHDPELVQASDRIFEITQKDGVSKVAQKEGTNDYR